MNKVSTKLFRLDLDYFKENFLNQETWGRKHLIYENSTIQVFLEQPEIHTSENRLKFVVSVKIIDTSYFWNAFEVKEEKYYSWSKNEGSDYFTIPIEHDEYTGINFASKVYSGFKGAFYGALYYLSETPLIKELKEMRETNKKALRKIAHSIYEKSRATTIKAVISKNTFATHYVNRDKLNAKLYSTEKQLSNNLKNTLMEKDVKLFCDFLGLKYKQSDDIATYYEAVAVAKELLNENS